MSEDGFPADLERFGTVPDPVPVRGDARLADEISEGGDVTQHVVEIEDGEPLCGAAVADDAPVYPFRGQRELIVRGMDDRCEDCVDELQSEVAPMPEDLGSVWYVIREHKTDRSTVVAGPIDDDGEARRRAHMEPVPAEPMLGIWLVYNIEAEDYEVDWADGVDRPEATVEQSEGGHNHA